MMSRIWTITPNPALDFTYRIPALHYGQSHRVEDIVVRPGGKGINVSRVLAQRGYASTMTGFLGGLNGQRFADLLAKHTDPSLTKAAFVDSAAETRMSIAVVDADATVFNEAGGAPSDAQWEDLCAFLAQSVAPGDIVASCGSFPGDSSPQWIRRIIEVVHEAQARILVDASGEILRVACDAGADLVKPNDIELRETTGADDIATGSRMLLDRGVGIVITSEGAKGMSIHATDGAFRALPAQRVEGNPTGAGDASVAAWCAFLSELSEPLSAAALAPALPQAVALSGAAVACPTAGEVDLSLYEDMLPRVKVEAY